jgi:tetratricopeptide (TPR) repeat protein
MLDRLSLTLAAALALGLAGCSEAPLPTNEDARRALEANDLATARSHVAEILAHGGADDETQRIKLSVMLELGDGYAAMGAIDALSDKALGPQDRRVAQAHALILQGKPQLALDLYAEVDDANLAEQDFRMKAWAYRDLGEDEAFATTMDAALEAFRDSPDLNALAAWQLIDLDLPEEAGSFADRALAGVPDHYDALMAKGRLAISEDDIEAALRHYRAAAEGHPARALPIVTVGGLLLDLGRVEEAGRTLRAASAAHPDDPFLQWQYARLALAENDLGTARLALETARRTYRGNDEFTLFTAQAEERFGNRALALAEYRRYLRAVGSDEGVERKIAELEGAS